MSTLTSEPTSITRIGPSTPGISLYVFELTWAHEPTLTRICSVLAFNEDEAVEIMWRRYPEEWRERMRTYQLRKIETWSDDKIAWSVHSVKRPKVIVNR